MPTLTAVFSAALATAAMTLLPASPPAPAHTVHRPATSVAPRAGAASTRPWAGYPDVPARLPASAAAAQSAISNIGTVGSLNWSGYAVSRRGISFRSVTATFFVPYLNCAQSPGMTMSSAWAGLDGFVGHPESVEQAGIAADCSASGAASYAAWFEMFPLAQANVTISIHPGDSVTVAVSYSAATGVFRLVVTDNTRGSHFVRYRKCPDVKIGGKRLRCLRNSAEVIAEAPASNVGQQLVIEPLSDYGAISFASIAISDGSGHRASIVSPHWSATKIIELRSSGGLTIARPTPTQLTMFDSYWFRES